MYLSRNLTGLSYKEIGKMFGNRDHSTVIYAVTSINKGIKDRKNKIIYDINKIKSFFS
jgi:chromosomal replication initiator protein